MKPQTALADIRDLTDAQLAEVATLFATANLAALQAIAKDPKASVLKVWFAAVAVQAIKKGDMYALDTLLTRILGKPSAGPEIEPVVKGAPDDLPPDVRASRIAELERLDRLLGDD